jgi:ferric-dicitrate binding protein FerR (iron transport regulator)
MPIPDDPLEPLGGEPTDIRWRTDALWDRVRADTIDAPARPRRLPVFRRVGPTTRVGLFAGLGAVAATIAFLVLGGRFETSRLTSGPAREYVTAAGERATIHLSEGSVVMLAPRSRLVVPASYGTGSRKLTLVGRGSFDVRHDSMSPMVVTAGDAVIEDIGTYFTVSAYPDEEVVVEVTEGEAVLTGDEGAAVRLRTGSAGTVGADGAATFSGPARPHARAWENGRLTFEKESLRSVLNTIERWYDLEIQVDSALSARRVTAEFTASRPAEMIDALATALDARVSRRGKVVLLSGPKP